MSGGRDERHEDESQQRAQASGALEVDAASDAAAQRARDQHQGPAMSGSESGAPVSAEARRLSARRAARYQELARKEAEHWSGVTSGPETPQIWDDPVLQEIFFGAEERRFMARAMQSGLRVLELGCGEGELATELARAGMRVTAIDLSAARIQAARSRATEVGPRFTVGNLDIMPLPDGPFDCVIAHDSLHHIVELDRLLVEVERVLRPGGRLLVADFCGMVPPARALSALMYALLPTHMSYARKWGLRRRLPAFLASERQKRVALARGRGEALHESSPFEGISQESIVPSIARRFEILEHRTFLPFWWYLVAKLRLGGLRQPVAHLFRRWDDGLLRLGVPGAYFVLEARRRDGTR